MQHAGMVHALEKIQQLLKPDGLLIDIHPTTEPAALAVRLREQIIPAGWVDEATTTWNMSGRTKRCSA